MHRDQFTGHCNFSQQPLFRCYSGIIKNSLQYALERRLFCPGTDFPWATGPGSKSDTSYDAALRNGWDPGEAYVSIIRELGRGTHLTHHGNPALCKCFLLTTNQLDLKAAGSKVILKDIVFLIQKDT